MVYKLKYKDIPQVKLALVMKQKGICPICRRDLTLLPSREVCLDHNHKTGRIRAVLCRGCNSMEGKVHRAFQRVGLEKRGVPYKVFLFYLGDYVTWEEIDLIHPSYKDKKVKK